MIRLVRLMCAAWRFAEAERRVDDYYREMERRGVHHTDDDCERCAGGVEVDCGRDEARAAYLALRRGA